MGSLYLGGPTIQEVDGKMMMGLSIYGVAVIHRIIYDVIVILVPLLFSEHVPNHYL